MVSELLVRGQHAHRDHQDRLGGADPSSEAHSRRVTTRPGMGLGAGENRAFGGDVCIANWKDPPFFSWKTQSKWDFMVILWWFDGI